MHGQAWLCALCAFLLPPLICKVNDDFNYPVHGRHISTSLHGPLQGKEPQNSANREQLRKVFV